jgi:TetR/AcrR family transcriptional repressor of nem operon
MRYSGEHKQQTRERIVRAAARRFRSRGSQGAAIADLMRDLRLTHGGFYRHFGSKEDLFIEAFEHDELFHRVARAIEQVEPGTELKALIDAYLDIEHCNNVADGCAVTALASELARRPAGSRARLAFERVLKGRTQRVAKYMPGATEEERVRKARMLMSGMAGTLTIARVLNDDRQRRRFLDDAKKFYFDAVQR